MDPLPNSSAIPSYPRFFLLGETKTVDARVKPGHDELCQ